MGAIIMTSIPFAAARSFYLVELIYGGEDVSIRGLGVAADLLDAVPGEVLEVLIGGGRSLTA